MLVNASGCNQETSLAAGANAFLPKPIHCEHLLARIADLLKLVWIYEQSPTAQHAMSGHIPSVVMPSQEEMEVLYRLARLGSVGATSKRAAYLDIDHDRISPTDGGPLQKLLKVILRLP